MGQNATSSLLNRLAKQGVISRASSADSPKLTFQISERFFNIWYLMRASRRLRRRLLWLVGFLQSFYGAAELERRASALLEASGEAANDPARLLAFASAVSDEKLRQHLELRAVQRMVEGPKPFEHWRELLDLDGEDRHLGKLIEHSLSASSETAQADDLFGSEAGRLLARNPYLAEIVKQQIRDSGIDEELTHALLMSSETWKLLYGERVLAAIEAGELPSFADVANEDELWRLVAWAETDAHFAAILYSVLLMVKWQLSDEAALKLTETPLTTMLLVLVIPTKYRERWTEGEALIRRLLEHCVHEPSSPMLFPSVWIDFVMEGRAEQAAQALFDTGKHELALPLYEALRAIGRGAPSSLLHLPAELRSSTAQVVSELLNVQEDAATARIEMKRLFNPKKKQTKQRSRGSVAKKPRRPAP